jgi:integrase
VQDRPLLHIVISNATVLRAAAWGQRSRRARDKVWTAEQLRTFLDHLRGNDDRLYALWHLITTTGMRREDALGLRWPCVDLDERHIVIRETLTVAGNKPLFQELAKSEAGERMIALDTGTVAVIREHHRRQAAERLAIGPGWSGRPQDADLVFTQPTGKHLHPKKVSAAFTRHADRLGLPRIGVHGLRHTWATLAFRAGVPVAVVSQRIGHADPAITYGTYAWALEGDDRAAAETAAAAILGD